MKILITGAAGSVGTVLSKGLRDRHTLRGFDRQPMPELEDSLQGNIADFDAVLGASEGMDGNRAPGHLQGKGRGLGGILHPHAPWNL